MCYTPGEKDPTNTRLARALVCTTRISVEIRKILTVQGPVTPKRAGASDSKINDDGVSTFKEACSGRYSGSLKLSSRRFERAQNRSVPFLTLFSIAPEVNGLGWYCAVIRAKFGVKTAHARVPFLPGPDLRIALRASSRLCTTVFSMLHATTLKNLEWAWGQGYV